MKTLDNLNKAIYYIILGFVIGVILTNMLYTCGSSPVKKNTNIKPIIEQRDSVKLKVEILDSIKNAKIIEVSGLSNDSTVKLFYELVKEQY